MPLYDYQCSSCGHIHEVLKARTAEDPTVCGACNAPSLKRLLSKTQFHLKGGGWYKDGYDRTGSTKDTSSAASTTTSSESKASASASTTTTSSSSDTTP